MDASPTPLDGRFVLLTDETIDMLTMARRAFLEQRRALVKSVLALGEDVHRAEKALTGGIVPVAAEGGGNPMEAEKVFVPMHLERIGDNIEAFARAVDRQMQDGVLFTDRAMREIDNLLEHALELLEATRDILRTGNRTLVHHVLTDGPRFQATASEFASFHQERLIQGLCRPHASSIYLAMIDYLRGIERHQRDIVRKVTAHAVASHAAPGPVVGAGAEDSR
jgi:Na+/phosphate symporter